MNPSTPKVSIITINYNNLEGLKRTVESVVNQTWQEFEYIIIDGGSTDGSAEYIESQSEHINYWISEPDKGIYNAMNKGIAQATGEYLLFLNSGDHFYCNTVLQENIEHLQKHDLIYFNIEVAGAISSEIVSYPDKLRFSDLCFGTLCHQSTFIKNTLFHTVGLYDENLKIASDWKFFILALFNYHCSYVKIDKTVSTFYLGGISSQIGFSEEREEVLIEYFGEYFFDYQELRKKNELLRTNRFKMLSEIENTTMGKKMVSLFFRIYIVLFSKKKLKNILK
jgi:glycosyltransferase involved in cell wall biosynthesis